MCTGADMYQYMITDMCCVCVCFMCCVHVCVCVGGVCLSVRIYINIKDGV